MKIEEKQSAISLRRSGCSIKEIAGRIGVSPGSVSLWVKGIELTDEQKLVLMNRNPILNHQLAGANARHDKAYAIRQTYQLDGRRMALVGDANFIAGCMLYWAEGSKGMNRVELANTDKYMLKFFISFLRKWFDIKDDAFAISTQWYSSSGNTLDDVQVYWTTELGLPMSCMRKCLVDNISKYSQKKRGNKYPFGTCKVCVCRTDVLQKIFGAIQEVGGFSDDKWL